MFTIVREFETFFLKTSKHFFENLGLNKTLFMNMYILTISLQHFPTKMDDEERANKVYQKF